jgi:hypothetical protein
VRRTLERAQLADAGLDHLDVGTVDDRHLAVFVSLAR